MRTVRRVALAQRFRPYTGPTPPPITETQALEFRAIGEEEHRYSLGLWDVGIVHTDNRPVTWKPVWIIAHDVYLEDLTQLFISGPMSPPPGAKPDPAPTGGGWVRYVMMRDARTGTRVITVRF